MDILELKNICYRYSDAKKDEFVFKDISYKFELGRVYAIRGRSGSGKTTLLSILSGLEKPTSGEVLYDNKKLSTLDLDEYRSKYIGIIFQSYNLLPKLTARENILLSMNISNVMCDDKNKEVERLLSDVGLESKHAKRRILKLSGGEQQRVAIARSISYNPKVILADEPTGNLDKETEDEILKIFSDLAHKNNKCIIIVTHSKNVCDQSDVVYTLK